MAPKIGYLLPTRERVMEGRPEAASLLDLAVGAENLGFDSVWVGDSLLARPRHDPLTLLAAAAARTKKVMLGTAVFLPALRNPVVLAHQLATPIRSVKDASCSARGSPATCLTSVPNSRQRGCRSKVGSDA